MNSASQLFIDGQWIKGSELAPVMNPANQEVVGQVYIAHSNHVDDAITAAEKAFVSWSGLPARKRADYLLKIRDLLLQNRKEIATVLSQEQGKPLAEAIGEIIYSAEFFGWFAEEAKRVYGELIPSNRANHELRIEYVPVGVVAVITPWNFPGGMMARKLAPALAAGCTVVVKPASQTPLTAVKFFEIMEKAELPAGVANLLMGSGTVIGNQLVQSPRVQKVTFTGSTEVGSNIMELAAKHITKISLELGGHAPFIVSEDADIDRAIKDLLMIKFRTSGQTCISPNRIFVHQQLYKQFSEKLVQKVSQLKVGRFDEEGVVVGPLIDHNAVQYMQKQVDDALQKGASLLYGGTICTENGLSTGHFYKPTIIADVSKEMMIFYEETFGPILPLIRYDTEEQLIDLANDSQFGLAAYVYSGDYNFARRIVNKLQYGTIAVNDISASDLAQVPVGGMKMSGIGREGGREGLKSFLETKYTLVNYL